VPGNRRRAAQLCPCLLPVYTSHSQQTLAEPVLSGLALVSFNCQGPGCWGITEQGRQLGKKTQIEDNTREKDDHQMGRVEKKEFKFSKGGT
jgi:hypothetical protein